MSDFLKRMAASSRDRASMLSANYSSAELERPLAPLTLAGFDVIAEIKDESPAEGRLSEPGSDREQRARDYAQSGAAAISVLTEPFRFAGEIGHLEAVAEAVADFSVPVMRKDFLVATSQVLEARAAGASGVLLIAAILNDDELRDLLACAHEHGLFVLLEAFDEEDLERCLVLFDETAYAEAVRAHKLLLGVNSRNLRTLDVDPERFADYASRIPATAVAVAESGLHTAADAAHVARLGYRMALVGTALMRASAPGNLLAGMIAAGRDT